MPLDLEKVERIQLHQFYNPNIQLPQWIRKHELSYMLSGAVLKTDDDGLSNPLLGLGADSET
jgi:hypothetical protein